MFEKLPWDIKREILLFDSRFILRNHYLININKIPREDDRYLLLSKIPKIYQISNNELSVLLCENTSKKRFILSYNSNFVDIREYAFYTFTYNYFYGRMNHNPDKIIRYYY
jgi:hypothetical protein